MIDVAFTLIQAKHQSNLSNGYECVVSKRQVQWYKLPPGVPGPPSHSPLWNATTVLQHLVKGDQC